MEITQTTFCSKCGNELSGGTAFCSKCGEAPKSSAKALDSSKWEYMIKSVTIADRWSRKGQEKEIQNLESILNSRGAEGWEMLSYESIPMYGAFSQKLKGYAYLVFFKRPKR